MGKIILLDENTANQIAAGEVIERPASVVKEMVENAVDAGATQVSVEIRNGGIALIRVEDNGSGIEADDIEMAFERHGTSKIRSIGDLDSLSTMGFRGEALASIASVSRLEVTTRTLSMQGGVQARLEGGRILEVTQRGSTVGTRFLVRDLFFNTPARYKFLKKDATEAGFVADVLTRLALCHPDVAIQLTSNGQEVFRTPGNGDLLSTVYSLYGKETAQELLPLDHEEKGVRVTGFVGKPSIARGTRARQSILMNRRSIRNATVTAALDDAFRTLLMTRQYAFAVLHLSVSPAAVDVNVHPAKLEVRFSDEGLIFGAVNHAVRNALMKASLLRDQVLLPDVEPKPRQEAPARAATAADDRFGAHAGTGGHRGAVMAGTGYVRENPPAGNIDWKRLYQPLSFAGKPQAGQEPAVSDAAAASIEPMYPSAGSVGSVESAGSVESVGSAGRSERTVEVNYKPGEGILPAHASISEPDCAVPAGGEALQTRRWAGARIVGQVLDTYIVLETDREMLMIDQHAAHERIRYETLREAYARDDVPAQMLMAPLAVSVSDLEYAFIADRGEAFSKVGFEVEPFGRGTVLVRAVPGIYADGLSPAEFLQIADAWMNDPGSRGSRISEAVLHQMSCKGAIKANRHMNIREMQALVDQLARMENPYTCVHGRPVILRFSAHELEKRFRRIV